MTSRNITASIQGRLREIAKTTNRPFQELLEHFAMERFLYRLSISSHRNTFVLKGALLLRVSDNTSARPTRDIDFLGRTDNSPDSISGLVAEICATTVAQEDGLNFRQFKTEVIREDADYEGVRVQFEALHANVKIPMQIDVGFGDIMIPGAQTITYPALLDWPTPQLLGYPLESVIAEKLEALVKLGTINSRMKDFYDLWHIARRFDFEGPALCRAVKTTFLHRGTPIAVEPVGLSQDFAQNNERQWQAFLRRTRLPASNFGEVLEEVTDFAAPILKHCHDRGDFEARWMAPGPWHFGVR